MALICMLSVNITAILNLDLCVFYFEFQSPEKVILVLFPAVWLACQPRHLTAFDNRGLLSFQWLQTRQTLWVDFLQVLTNRNLNILPSSIYTLPGCKCSSICFCNFSICAPFGTSLEFLSLRIPNPEQVSLILFFLQQLKLKASWTSFVLRVTCHIWWQSSSC